MDKSPRSPLHAVHGHCLWCCNEKASEVALCPARHCPLRLLRSGHRPTLVEIEHNADVTLHPSERRTTVGELHGGGGAVLKAIRRRCLDCSGNSSGEVRSYKYDTCPLHPFRWVRIRTSGCRPSARPRCWSGLSNETPVAAKKCPQDRAFAAAREAGYPWCQQRVQRQFLWWILSRF